MGQELTTLGAVVRFAISLETEAAERYEQAGPEQAPALRVAEEHRKRAEQLSRMMREQLNEMILEPISGLQAEEYSGGTTAAEVESDLARLYEDIGERAGHIFPGASRTLVRFAERSRRLAGE